MPSKVKINLAIKHSASKQDLRHTHGLRCNSFPLRKPGRAAHKARTLQQACRWVSESMRKRDDSAGQQEKEFLALAKC